MLAYWLVSAVASEAIHLYHEDREGCVSLNSGNPPLRLAKKIVSPSCNGNITFPYESAVWFANSSPRQ